MNDYKKERKIIPETTLGKSSIIRIIYHLTWFDEASKYKI